MSSTSDYLASITPNDLGYIEDNTQQNNSSSQSSPGLFQEFLDWAKQKQKEITGYDYVPNEEIQQQANEGVNNALSNASYGTTIPVGIAGGMANMGSGVFSALGIDSGSENTDKFNKRVSQYLPQNPDYTSSEYWTNPWGTAYAGANALGSSIPIAIAGTMMPEAMAARGAGLMTNGLAHVGLGGAARSRIGQAVLGEVAKAYPATVLDSTNEYGNVVYDLMQKGYSSADARIKALPVLAGNIALDTFTVPAELSLMKGASFTKKLFTPEEGEMLAQRIAYGVPRVAVGTTLGMGANAAIEGGQELAQQTMSDSVEGNQVGNMLNPADWSPAQRQSAWEGAIGGAILGAPGNIKSNYSRYREESQEETPSIEQPTEQPIEQSSAIEPSGNEYIDVVRAAANEQNINPNIGLAVAARETGGDDVNAINMADNGGLMQITPETASNYGIDEKYPGWDSDPQANARAGMYILNKKIEENNGDVWAGVRAYNGAGEAADNYLSQVQSDYNSLGGESGESGYAMRDLPMQDIEDTGLQHTNPALVNAVKSLNGWVYNNFGEDLTVSGGWRSPEHNAEVNGAEHSHHLDGEAIDIVVPENFTEEQLESIKEKAKSMGFNSDGEDMFHDKGSGYHLHLTLPVGKLAGGNPTRSSFSNAAETKALNDIINDSSYDDIINSSSKFAAEDVATRHNDTSTDENEINRLAKMFVSGRHGDKFDATDTNVKSIQDEYSDEYQTALAGRLAETMLQAVPEGSEIANTITQAKKTGDIRSIANILKNNFSAQGNKIEFRGTNSMSPKIETVKTKEGVNYNEKIRETDKSNSSQENSVQSSESQQVATQGEGANSQEIENPHIAKMTGKAVKDSKIKAIVKRAMNGDTAANDMLNRNHVNKDVIKAVQGQLRKERKEQKAEVIANSLSGKTETIRTDSQKEFPASYRIVSADDITTSHHADGTQNIFYPEELQPRNRDRAGMQAQVNEITNKMNPADLGGSRSVNTGAPVIDESGYVLNGNGRGMAIKNAYKGKTKQAKQSADTYKQFLTDHAAEYGFTPEQVQSVKNPILVRQVADNAPVSDIIHSTNGGARLSAGEQAKVDAKKITLETLSKFSDSDMGDLTKPGNREFIKSAIHDIATTEDRNELTTSSGKASQQAIIRVKNALFAKAYGDDYLLGIMSESTDNEIRNIVNAMLIASPKMAALNDGMAKGNLYTFDVAGPIMQAAKKLRALRNEGKKVSVFLDETSFIGDYIGEEGKTILQFFDRNKQRVRIMSDMITGICANIEALGHPQQTSMFEVKNPTLKEIIDASIKNVEKGTQVDLFEGNSFEKLASLSPEEAVKLDKEQRDQWERSRTAETYQPIDRDIKSARELFDYFLLMDKPDYADKVIGRVENGMMDYSEAGDIALKPLNDLYSELTDKLNAYNSSHTDTKDKPRTPSKETVAALDELIKATGLKRKNKQSGDSNKPNTTKYSKPNTEKSSVKKSNTSQNDSNNKGPIHFHKDSPEEEAKWKQQLKNNLNKIGANIIFDPDIMVPAFHLGAIYFQRGANTLVNFAKAMRDAAGEKIEPWIRPVFNAIETYPKNQVINDNQLAVAFKFAMAEFNDGVTDLKDIQKDFSDAVGEEEAKPFMGLLQAAHKGAETFVAQSKDKNSTSISDNSVSTNDTEITNINTHNTINDTNVDNTETAPDALHAGFSVAKIYAGKPLSEVNGKAFIFVGDNQVPGNKNFTDISKETNINHPVGVRLYVETLREMNDTVYNKIKQAGYDSIENAILDTAKKHTLTHSGTALTLSGDNVDITLSPIIEKKLMGHKESYHVVTGISIKGMSDNGNEGNIGTGESIGNGHQGMEPGNVPTDEKIGEHSKPTSEDTREQQTVSDGNGKGTDIQDKPISGSTRKDSGDKRGEDTGAGNGTGTNKPPVLRDSQKKNASATEIPGHNLQISEDSDIGNGGKKSKFKQNIEALKLLKQLISEDRMATPKEQATLAKYNGWGGLSDVFTNKPDWAKEQSELRAIITDEEYKNIRSTVNTAFYTDPTIVKKIWDAVIKLGFKGGKILDPSMGTGMFFGCMPKNISGKSTLTGYEIDPITGSLAKQLYQKAIVNIMGFEKIGNSNDGYYDIAISNVPFADFGVNDPKYNKDKLKIHNYFFVKAMDKVRPGGLVVFITSQKTMQGLYDSQTMRNILKDKADLIAAIKLPNTAFKGNAGTDVTSDLIILQKKEPDVSHDLYAKDWDEVTTIYKQDKNGKQVPLQINKYFSNNPNNVLGNIEVSYGAHGVGKLPAVNGKNVDIENRLSSIIETLPEIYSPKKERSVPSEQDIQNAIEADMSKRDYSFYVDNKTGKLVQRDGDIVKLVPKNKAAKIYSYLELKDALNNLLVAERSTEYSDKEILNIRTLLNNAYDKFVKNYGNVNSKDNIKDIGMDPDYGSIMALEHPHKDKEGNIIKDEFDKAKIFSERIIPAIKNIEKVESPSDALMASLSNKNNIDLEYMSALSGLNQDVLISNLKGSIYKDPETENYVTADEYLSGNVREKLEIAENLVNTHPEYRENVKELKSVQPKDLMPSEISISLGVPWVPESDVVDYITETVLSSGVVSCKYHALTGKWSVECHGEANSKYLSGRADVEKIIEHALNIRTFTFKDSDGNVLVEESALVNQNVKDIRDGFEPWIRFNEERSERLAAYYNRNFNNLRMREYNGSHLSFPGSNRGISLKDHQKNAAWRIMQPGNTLLAHCVGAGKTFTMQASAMEMKRLGIINKPLFAVPNNVVIQFGKEFRELYPDAKILTISSQQLPSVYIPKKDKNGNVSKKEEEKSAISLNKRNRELARIKTEDWDAVIISHDTLKRLSMSPESYQAFYQEQLDLLDAAYEDEMESVNRDKNYIKKIEEAKEKLREKMEKAMSVDKKYIGIPFEDSGIDYMYVDEADRFKNLFFNTHLQVSGISTTNSQQATDMYAKTWYLNHATNYHGLCFATGTPISNTMNELFTMQRYLDPVTLEEDGTKYFDAWVGTYAKIEEQFVLSADGNGYKKQQTLKFSNIPELVQRFRKFADVKRPEELNLDVPRLKNGKNTIITVKPSPDLVYFIKDTIKRRAEMVRNQGRKKQKGEDNMLSITNDLRMASLDLRILQEGKLDKDLEYPEEAGSKIKSCAAMVAKKYKETANVKGAQLIFCDKSTPGDGSKGNSKHITEENIDSFTGFTNAYDELKKELIKLGIPSSQIAYVHDAKNKAEQSELFKQVDTGNLRIIIGSTEKMGAGTNFQHHLVALHHLDCPWRPRDIEQREGRIIRRGNINKEVEIFNYITKGSFDANMWEKIKNKAMMIAQAMSGDTTQRVIDDSSDISGDYAEILSLSSDNPLIGEKAQIEGNINLYQRMKFAHDKEVKIAQEEKLTLPSKISSIEESISRAQKDIESIPDIKGDDFSIIIDGKTYTDRKSAKESLDNLLKDFHETTSTKIGSIGNFDIKAMKSGSIAKDNYGNVISDNTSIQLVNNLAYKCSTTSLESIVSTLRNAPNTRLKELKSNLSVFENRLKELEEKVKTSFDHQDELDKNKKRLEEIINIMQKDTEKEDNKQSSSPDKISEGGDTKYQLAAHGSPHIIDNFDFSKIGTGEGHQIHGYGIYLAQDVEVSANRYRDRLAEKQKTQYIIMKDGTNIPVPTGNNKKDVAIPDKYKDLYNNMLNEFSRVGSIPDLDRDKFVGIMTYRIIMNLEMASRRLDSAKEIGSPGNIKRASKILSEAEDKAQQSISALDDIVSVEEYNDNPGSLLMVEIPENNELLDEHLPLYKQSSQIIDGVHKAVNYAISLNKPSDVKSLKESEIVEYAIDGKREEVALLSRKIMNNDNERENAKKLDAILDRDYFSNYSINENNQEERINVIMSDLFHTDSEQIMANLKYDRRISSLKRDAAKLDKMNGEQIQSLLHDAIPSTPGIRQDKKVSETLNKFGVKGYTYIGGIDGRCFVIFTPEAMEIKQRYDAAMNNNRDEIKRSYDECVAELDEMFKGYKSKKQEGDYIHYVMPENKHVYVSIKDQMVINGKEMERAKQEHGMSDSQDVVVEGSWRTISPEGNEGLLQLSRESAKGTGYHESMHAIMDLALTPRENAALKSEFEKKAKEQGIRWEEAVANGAIEWKAARAKGKGTAFGRLFQKMKDFAMRLKSFFTRTDNFHNIMRKIESGEVWGRDNATTRNTESVLYSIRKQSDAIINKATTDLAKKMKSGKSKIEVNNYKEDELGIGIQDSIRRSPSRLADQIPKFAPFWRFGDKAMNKLTDLRSNFTRHLNKALDISKSKDDREGLFEVLWNGDAEGKDYTEDELKESGYSDNTIESYKRIRRLMRRAYTLLDDARRRAQVKSVRIPAEALALLKGNKFIEIMSDEEINGKHLVTYKEFANWEKHYLLTQDQLDAMDKDDAVQVLDHEDTGEFSDDGDALYDVTVRESIPPIHKLGGYIPHFFHEYMIRIKKEDAEGNEVFQTVGSGRTMNEAYNKAKKLAETLGSEESIVITPKQFNFASLGMDEAKTAATMGDKDFYKTLNRIAKNNDITVEQAKEMLKGSVKQKNRHRFFGNFLQRQGVAGYEKDMEWVLRHYFSTASRYVAMETEFKPKAISMFERLFGAYDKEYRGLPKYIKEYIEDMNGNPSSLEAQINRFLHNRFLFRRFAETQFGERAALQFANSLTGKVSILKLGFLNISSAMINFTQIATVAGYTGNISMLWKVMARGAHNKYSMHDKKILKESGVFNDIGLDSGSGYSKLSAGKWANRSMILFKTAEGIIRRGTIIAVYNEGRKRGMSHNVAMNWAREINRKANGDYSIADAPNVFRRGSIVSQLLLQFKKYPLKQLEAMEDFIPIRSNKTSAKQKAIFWGTYFLMAGLFQIPFGDWLDDLVATVTEKTGKRRSPKETAQDYIIRLCSTYPDLKPLGKVAMYGIGAVAGVDISSRVGLSDIIPNKVTDAMGPVASTVVNTTANIFNANDVGALRSLSPGLANLYMAGTGKSIGNRGRVNAEYNTPYDRMLRAMGFKSTEEADDYIIQNLLYEKKKEARSEKQQAVDDYIADPSPKNAMRLKKLNISKKTVDEERKKKQQTRSERNSGSLSKADQKEYSYLTSF